MDFSAYETVLELRRYTLRPGRRDELISLFEREFVAPQEAVGAHLFGLFRTPSSPDEFVWLRGFSSLAARVDALTAFYTGPVWRRFREEANATMVDSDNVLLLRPVVRGLASPPPGSGVYLSFGEAPAAFAVFETEPGPNNFPQLPVRTDGPFMVSFSRSPSPGSESLEATSRSLLR
ncbi:Quinol monooxygenase YgiN [Amycolatopsis pretoriensis]|uniref:Quinol monooxygenase YgiN n=1 Tax=Amycolatopsis pretoriensis TaxID=218821 RepID=A0A1H5R684_9PSEU|nr:NIPSNAP family protein [Amycolatopsis pretoriensis]SEF33829.1 Quinol monooxygenase YgiN [Amycolatopsis pretoriensis]